jgi:hypothetical protein
VETIESPRNPGRFSFLTHARLLIEFIAGRPDAGDPNIRKRNVRDITPAMFGLPNWSPNVFNYFDAQLELMDKYLAHLSKDRGRLTTARLWAVDRIANPLLAEFANFADALRASGNTKCAAAISSGVSEALNLMKKEVRL